MADIVLHDLHREIKRGIPHIEADHVAVLVIADAAIRVREVTVAGILIAKPGMETPEGMRQFMRAVPAGEGALPIPFEAAILLGICEGRPRPRCPWRGLPEAGCAPDPTCCATGGHRHRPLSDR